MLERTFHVVVVEVEDVQTILMLSPEAVEERDPNTPEVVCLSPIRISWPAVCVTCQPAAPVKVISMMVPGANPVVPFAGSGRSKVPPEAHIYPELIVILGVTLAVITFHVVTQGNPWGPWGPIGPWEP